MNWIDGASIIFAIAAAALWFFASIVKTPVLKQPEVQISEMMAGGGFPRLFEAVKKQSRLNAYGAACAAVAAVLQAASFYSKLP